jgi:hypothetical protein
LYSEKGKAGRGRALNRRIKGFPSKRNMKVIMIINSVALNVPLKYINHCGNNGDCWTKKLWRRDILL